MTRCFAELIGGKYDGDEIELPDYTEPQWEKTRSFLIRPEGPDPVLVAMSTSERYFDELITYLRPERLLGRVREVERGSETVWLITALCDIDEEVFFGGLMP